jgi:hypothetical protein
MDAGCELRASDGRAGKRSPAIACCSAHSSVHVPHRIFLAQDMVLFNDTIYYNIAYGRPGASQVAGGG